jgi:1-acyl-sn-glycerol-3-phosphate acyltransferase
MEASGVAAAGADGRGGRRDSHEPRRLPYSATALITRPLFRSALRLTVVSPERIPVRGPLVIVANHESNLDGFVLISAFAERRLRFLSAAHLFERPAVGRYLRAIGALPVEEEASNLSSFRTALAILAAGGTVAVFPQGGIDRDEIAGGAAYLALKAQAALLPVRLAGTAHVLPPGRGWPSLGRVTVRIGRPAHAHSLADGGSTTKTAVAEVSRAVKRLLAET